MRKQQTYTCTVILLFLIGIAARGVLLGAVPGGINQDEAFGAYEAYSLCHYGVDSSGYSFPVYLNSRGNGMSALNSYLMIPFIALFGLHTWVIRIPQFLTSCFTLYAAYKLLLKLFDQKTALLGFCYLSVCPWHIMVSRWGMDCNLTPGFLLFAFYFFLLGVNNSKYYMLSGLFYGLSLYCYATIWPIVPLMLLLQFGYLLYTRRFQPNLHVWLAVGILALLALPLLLFLLVNSGFLPEIRTPFFSIPRMVEMRSSEFSFRNMRWNLRTLILMLLKQNDGLYWNATAEFGLYYKGALVFAAIGFCLCVRRLFVSIKKRTYDGAVLLLVPFLCSVLLGCTIEVNVNRINAIHIPMILFIIMGLCGVLSFLEKRLRFRYAWHTALAALLLCFICFESFYFTSYREKIGVFFQEGLEESVEYAMTLAGEDKDIYIAPGINHSKILYYSRMPVTEYLENIEYANEQGSYLKLVSCGQFYFHLPDIPKGAVGIIPEDSIAEFVEAGWRIEQFGHTAVVY